MKALETGTAVSVAMPHDKQNIMICAVYSPGLKGVKGMNETWVQWEIKRNQSQEGQDYWSARAYRTLEGGIRLPIPLDNFSGYNGIDSERITSLLIGIGLESSMRTHQERGTMPTFSEQAIGMKTEHSLSSIQQRPWFFSNRLAATATEQVEED